MRKCSRQPAKQSEQRTPKNGPAADAPSGKSAGRRGGGCARGLEKGMASRASVQDVHRRPQSGLRRRFVPFERALLGDLSPRASFLAPSPRSIHSKMTRGQCTTRCELNPPGLGAHDGDDTPLGLCLAASGPCRPDPLAALILGLLSLPSSSALVLVRTRYRSSVTAASQRSRSWLRRSKLSSASLASSSSFSPGAGDGREKRAPTSLERSEAKSAAEPDERARALTSEEARTGEARAGADQRAVRTRCANRSAP